MLLLFSKILRNTIINCKNIFVGKRVLKSIKMKEMNNNSWPMYGSIRYESVKIDQMFHIIVAVLTIKTNFWQGLCRGHISLNKIKMKKKKKNKQVHIKSTNNRNKVRKSLPKLLFNWYEMF